MLRTILVGTDFLNPKIINIVKNLTEKLTGLNDIEEESLKQQSKIDWLSLKEGKNKFFYVSLKSEANQTTIKQLRKDDDTFISKHVDIEEEVLDFFGRLMGRADTNLNIMDIDDMRKGTQITMEQRRDLIVPVTEAEIVKALKDIGDLKASGADGYGSKFLKLLGILSEMILEQLSMISLRKALCTGCQWNSCNSHPQEPCS